MCISYKYKVKAIPKPCGDSQAYVLIVGYTMDMMKEKYRVVSNFTGDVTLSLFYLVLT